MFLSSNLPRGATWTFKPAVGLFVVDEDFFDGVPFERTIEPITDIAEMAVADCAVSSLDVTERLLACLHTIQEVAENAARAAVIGNNDLGRWDSS